MKDNELIIKLDKLSFSRDNKVIFDNVNYVFKKGIYVLQGESGIGKTTLLNLIMNFLKPDSGGVYYDDDIKIGYLFQEDLLFHNLSVKENMMIKCYALQMDRAMVDEKIMYWSKQYKVSDKLNKQVSTLSGGEKKRVQLAMMSLEECNVFLLDEPIANLDKENGDMIMNYMFGMKDKLVIIVSHQYINQKDKCYTLLEMRENQLYEK